MAEIPEGLRHPPGRGSQIAPDERRTIQLDALTGGFNKSQLAQKYGRTREAITGVLSGADFDALKEQTAEDLKADALALLRMNVVAAANAWGQAMLAGAEKGNHTPAKELLFYAGA